MGAGESMTLAELNKAVGYAKTFDGRVPGETELFIKEVYNPIKKAIIDNVRTVIQYLEGCPPEYRWYVSTAVEDAVKEIKTLNKGVLPRKYRRVAKLCEGMTIDPIPKSMKEMV